MEFDILSDPPTEDEIETMKVEELNSHGLSNLKNPDCYFRLMKWSHSALMLFCLWYIVFVFLESNFDCFHMKDDDYLTVLKVSIPFFVGVFCAFAFLSPLHKKANLLKEKRNNLLFLFEPVNKEGFIEIAEAVSDEAVSHYCKKVVGQGRDFLNFERKAIAIWIEGAGGREREAALEEKYKEAKQAICDLGD